MEIPNSTQKIISAIDRHFEVGVPKPGFMPNQEEIRVASDQHPPFCPSAETIRLHRPAHAAPTATSPADMLAGYRIEVTEGSGHIQTDFTLDPDQGTVYMRQTVVYPGDDRPLTHETPGAFDNRKRREMLPEAIAHVLGGAAKETPNVLGRAMDTGEVTSLLDWLTKAKPSDT